MKRIDLPFALSVLVGALLGGGLLFLVVSPLKPPSSVFSETTDAEIAGQPTHPTEGARLGPAHPAALKTPSPQPGQKRSGSTQQDRGVYPVRPAIPPVAATRPAPASLLPAAAIPPTPTDPKSVKTTTEPASRATHREADIVQAPTPLPTEQGPLFMIQVGPVADPERAVEIVKHLALIGLAAGMLAREDLTPPHFAVVSDTVPLAVAERRVVALTQLGFRPHLRTLAGGYAQLRFGEFASQQEADRLARAVRITGFAFATVVREGGTVYLVTLGPHRPETVETIQRVLRSRFRAMLPVTVTPIN